MAEIRIKVGSITNAQRAKKVLSEQGYRVKIKRSITIAKGEGCGYSVVLYANEDEAVKLLKKRGIRVISVDTQ